MATVVSTVSSAKKTLVVNSAFLQEIKESHPEFWHTLHHVRQICEDVEQPSHVTRDLVRLLNELRDKMALQFALEEAYGYIEVAPEFSSCKVNAAEKIMAQHCSLYLQLSELIEKAEELQYRGAIAACVQELVDQTQAFDAKLQEHEQAENGLIENSHHAG
ncbi:hypothetical protein [Novipirellula caenicola]|uniref:Hemerythrin-like domain-containing protein n=1 Tax=Novipirellula caenicola TaxID=1536901 RepID=A0ABP9VRJ7_9BACT